MTEIGDVAAAAGMELVSGSEPANTLADLINQTRDYIVTVFAARPDLFPPPAHSINDHTGVLEAAKGGTGVAGGWNALVTRVSAAEKEISDASAVGSSSPGDLVRWGSSGTISVPAPSAPSHPTPRSWVQAELADKAEADLVDNILMGELAAAVWSRDITGTRRAVWMGSPSGGYLELGYASSSRHKKQNIRPAELTLDQLRRIPVVLYRYRKQVAAERAGKIDRAATEIGTIAEDLHALGLWPFVAYEGRGDDAKPAGVHYELLGLAALSLAQQLADKLDELTDRITRLENGATA